MKKINLLFFFIFSLSFGQLGINTLQPNGAVDIDSSISGVLIPMIELTSKNIALPVENPNGSLLIGGTIIYNTVTSGITPNQVFPGFYYWDATNLNWIAIAGSGSKNWSNIGNSGTTLPTNFIGTSSTTDFVTKTNNSEITRVTSTGNLGIGISNPTGKLHIFENTGTSLNASNGTLTLEHGNNGGNSSILLKSRRNDGNDFGYIKYSDDGSGNGSSLENSLLEIGVGNDDFATASATQDDISFLPSGGLGIGTTKPNAKLHIEGTTAFTTATSGTINTIQLRNNGNFPTPFPTTNNAGTIYLIRNTSRTTNVTVNNIINYGTTTNTTFTITPAIGSIMIISNGVSWYRI